MYKLRQKWEIMDGCLQNSKLNRRVYTNQNILLSLKTLEIVCYHLDRHSFKTKQSPLTEA
jgi:hypothetical protein